jgi:site-specific recombinase XerD
MRLKELQFNLRAIIQFITCMTISEEEHAKNNLPAPVNEHSGLSVRRHLHPETVDRILRKYTALLGLDHGYSAHSMRATFITTALNNGASLDDGQS